MKFFKKNLIFLILLIIMPLTQAQVENYDNYSSLTIDFKLSGNITTNQDSGSKLDYLTTDLYYYPIASSRQKITYDNFITSPSVSVKQGHPLEFTWDQLEDIYTFNLDSEIETKNILYQLPHVSFPIQDLPNDLFVYTQPSEYIDINENIIQQTASLVEGQTDLYSAVFIIAEWVNDNIKYDLNTLTADVTQRSSWVIENKEGVCDEMTSLFISMLRSVGIPARFIAGTVYTNIDYSFGSHGWAEVYFPDYGWVPYDVTFGQYGYLSPSHLKLTESIDSYEPSSEYQWRASNVEITPNNLFMQTSIKEADGIAQSPFELDIRPLKDEVGQGSYVPIKVTITNPFDSYVSTTLTITKSPELTESNVKQIMLKPKQEKSIFWITKIPKDISPSFIYTTVLEVKDYYGLSSSSKLKYAASFDKISLSEAQDIITKKQLQEEKSYSTELSFKCSTEKDYYYIYEDININCDLKNIGNTQIDALKTCLDTDCQTTNLRISQEKTLTFTSNIKESKELTITSKNDLLDLSSFVNIKVLESPDVLVTFKDVPSSTEYNKYFDLNFILSTTVPIKNIKVSINDIEYSQILYSEGSQKVITTVNSKRFVNDPIKLKLEYQDENDHSYITEKTLPIEITNVPWYIKLIIKIKSLF